MTPARIISDNPACRSLFDVTEARAEHRAEQARVAVSVMILNQLGATNVMVSRLGLGMAALGRPGYINLGHGEDLGAARGASMEANARRVLDAAWAAGIRYFDAARSYGLGEAFLGRWLESARSHGVSQDVLGAIVAADLEVPMIRRRPCVKYFNDLDASAIERKPPRCLLRRDDPHSSTRTSSVASTLIPACDEI